jgi:hypothetical protein
MATKKALNFYKTYKIYYAHIHTHILMHMFSYNVHDTWGASMQADPSEFQDMQIDHSCYRRQLLSSPSSSSSSSSCNSTSSFNSGMPNWNINATVQLKKYYLPNFEIISLSAICWNSTSDWTIPTSFKMSSNSLLNHYHNIWCYIQSQILTVTILVITGVNYKPEPEMCNI